ncbi:hypothetical protein [uncultured Psychroserpens sp.]|uniref:hypothetical protein n=1 Tax=uncultured Psychroserpens sp. TaxID=255436 RepID=UPI00261652D7|nr:hypothetical protein [uncultured Psychroserpens sp.]
MAVQRIGKLIPPNNKGNEVRDKNLWIDYIELVCIYSYDGEMSRDDMIDEIGQIAKDYINENKTDGTDDEDSSEADIKWSNMAYDWLEFLKSRQEIYGNFYPYQVDGDMLKLKSKITRKRKIYIALLLSSNLNNSTNNATSKLTSSFEYISLKAFKEVLPKRAKSFLFGKNQLNHGNKFSGKLIAKIKKLGVELGDLATTYNEDDFDSRDSGDGGLDLFGYIPLDSRNKLNIPIFFGQCACGKDWKRKIAECEPAVWNDNLEFNKTSKPYPMIFIPRSYRTLDGEWLINRKHRNAIIFDRERILNNLTKSSNEFIDRLPANQIINDILTNKIPF